MVMNEADIDLAGMYGFINPALYVQMGREILNVADTDLWPVWFTKSSTVFRWR